MHNNRNHVYLILNEFAIFMNAFYKQRILLLFLGTITNLNIYISSQLKVTKRNKFKQKK